MHQVVVGSARVVRRRTGSASVVVPLASCAMSDPASLRAQARELRRAARSVRDGSAAVDDELRTLLDRYPLPSATMWHGAHADRYADVLAKALEGLGRIGRDAERYADDCEHEAARRERRADDLERTAVPR